MLAKCKMTGFLDVLEEEWSMKFSGRSITGCRRGKRQNHPLGCRQRGGECNPPSIRSARVGSLAIPPNSLRGIFPDRRRILPRACGGRSRRCRPQDVVFYALVGEVRFHIFGSGDAAEVERFQQHLPCPIRCRGARGNVRRVLELRVCCAHWTIENTSFPSGRQNFVNFLPSTAER